MGPRTAVSLFLTATAAPPHPLQESSLPQTSGGGAGGGARILPLLRGIHSIAVGIEGTSLGSAFINYFPHRFYF